MQYYDFTLCFGTLLWYYLSGTNFLDFKFDDILYLQLKMTSQCMLDLKYSFMLFALVVGLFCLACYFRLPNAQKIQKYQKTIMILSTSANILGPHPQNSQPQ